MVSFFQPGLVSEEEEEDSLSFDEEQHGSVVDVDKDTYSYTG